MSLSLEELEARCEVLSRRVADRSLTGRSSPPRSGGGTAAPTVDGPRPSIEVNVSAEDLAGGIAALEREKFRLEEQLRQVTLHLNVYKLLQQSLVQGGAPRPSLATTPNHAQLSHRETPSSLLPHGPAQDVPGHKRYGSPIQQLPPPLPAAEAPKASTSMNQTDQIYEELRIIRKQREEREAARQASLQAQVGVNPSAFRQTAAQRY